MSRRWLNQVVVGGEVTQAPKAGFFHLWCGPEHHTPIKVSINANFEETIAEGDWVTVHGIIRFHSWEQGVIIESHIIKIEERASSE